MARGGDRQAAEKGSQSFLVSKVSLSHWENELIVDTSV